MKRVNLVYYTCAFIGICVFLWFIFKMFTMPEQLNSEVLKTALNHSREQLLQSDYFEAHSTLQKLVVYERIVTFGKLALLFTWVTCLAIFILRAAEQQLLDGTPLKNYKIAPYFVVVIVMLLIGEAEFFVVGANLAKYSVKLTQDNLLLASICIVSIVFAYSMIYQLFYRGKPNAKYFGFVRKEVGGKTEIAK